MVVVAAVQRRGLLGPALGWAPLRWIGLRSYAIYLWHWPIFVLTRDGADLRFDGWWPLTLRLTLTLFLAEVSYRFVETPIRRGALGRAWAGLRTRSRAGRWRGAARRGAFALPAAGATLALGLAVAMAEPPDQVSVDEPATPAPPPPPSRAGAAPPALDDFAQAAERPTVSAAAAYVTLRAEPQFGPIGDLGAPRADAEVIVAAPPERAAADVPPIDANADDAADASLLVSDLDPSAPAGQAVARPSSPMQVAAIGDSVMLGAADTLTGAFEAIGMDAAVGRQLDPAIGLLRSYRDSGSLGSVVLLHLGNNGTITADQFDQIMDILSGVERVIFVNVLVPRSWEEPNNAVIAEGVARHAKARLVDWNRIGAGHDDFFRDDGYHLRPKGAQFYAAVLAGAVETS